MKQKTNWKGGAFFYVFYAGFFLIIIGFVASLIYYVMGHQIDLGIMGKLAGVIISYAIAISVFKKKNIEIINCIMVLGADGVRQELSDKKTNRLVNQGIQVAIQFGVKKGLKKFEKIINTTNNYDDKAIVYCIMGVLCERASREKEAIGYYQRALQCRPYYYLAEQKLKYYIDTYSNM